MVSEDKIIDTLVKEELRKTEIRTLKVTQVTLLVAGIFFSILGVYLSPYFFFLPFSFSGFLTGAVSGYLLGQWGWRRFFKGFRRSGLDFSTYVKRRREKNKRGKRPIWTVLVSLGGVYIIIRLAGPRLPFIGNFIFTLAGPMVLVLAIVGLIYIGKVEKIVNKR